MFKNNQKGIEWSKNPFCVYGRMGLDSEWMLLKKNINKKSIEKFLTYYKRTWRQVLITQGDPTDGDC